MGQRMSKQEQGGGKGKSTSRRLPVRERLLRTAAADASGAVTLRTDREKEVAKALHADAFGICDLSRYPPEFRLFAPIKRNLLRAGRVMVQP
jgi:hypothetical protein